MFCSVSKSIFYYAVKRRPLRLICGNVQNTAPLQVIILKQLGISHITQLHTSSLQCKGRINYPIEGEVSAFHQHNLRKYPPQLPGELVRPAFVCHEKRNIKYPPKKMWFVATLIRGMAIEDAVNQLKFCHRKGAVAVLETLIEAQKMAVADHNVEFASNLWVSESFCLQDSVLIGSRRHARGRVYPMKYRYVHYCCTLEEGTPPEHYYYHTRPLTPQELLSNWLQKQRERTVKKSI